jgi:hypothetical protein
MAFSAVSESRSICCFGTKINRLTEFLTFRVQSAKDENATPPEPPLKMETMKQITNRSERGTEPPIESLSQAAAPKPSEKTYHGRRLPDGACEVWIEETSVAAIGDAAKSGLARHPLPLCLEIRNHSPTGFEWGYGGSGPAQLALALLVDALGSVEIAEAHYQDFKREIVSGLGRDWSLRVQEIRDFVSKHAP